MKLRLERCDWNAVKQGGRRLTENATFIGFGEALLYQISEGSFRRGSGELVDFHGAGF